MKVGDVLDRGMTVGALIAELQQYDEDCPVVFISDYGDYGHTQQALTVASVDERESTDFTETAYSRSGIALRDPRDYEEDEDDEDDDDDDEPSGDAQPRSVVVLQ